MLLRPYTIVRSLDGRVVSKTSLRYRNRENDSLSVFSFVIQDETGKINVVAWDGVATGVHDFVKVGECYRLTMFKTKEVAASNSLYRVVDHELELTLTKVLFT